MKSLSRLAHRTKHQNRITSGKCGWTIVTGDHRTKRIMTQIKIENHKMKMRALSAKMSWVSTKKCWKRTNLMSLCDKKKNVQNYSKPTGTSKNNCSKKSCQVTQGNHGTNKQWWSGKQIIKTQRFLFRDQKKSLFRKSNKRSSSKDRCKMKSRKTSPHPQKHSNHKSSQSLKK